MNMLLFLSTTAMSDMTNTSIWQLKNSIPNMDLIFGRKLNMHYGST